MTLYQMLLTLRARRKVAVYCTLGTLLLMLGIGLFQNTVYVASASLVIDAKDPYPVTGVSIPAQLIPGYITTQAEIIASKRVAERVAQQLALENHPYYQQRHAVEAAPGVPFHSWIGDYLLKKLSVEPSKKTNVITMDFQAPTAALAVDILNAFITAFRQTTVEMRVEPARQSAIWFDDQVHILRQTLAAAQDKLSRFERENYLVAVGDVKDVEAVQLNELTLQSANAAAAGSEYLSKQGRTQALLDNGKPVDSLPDVLSNVTIQGMKSDLSREEKRLDEISTNYGSAHPQYVAQRAAVSRLKIAIRTEEARVVNSIAERARMAQQRDKSLQRSIDERMAAVLEMKQKRNELAVLSQEVRDAQRAYDDALQRRNNIRLESQVTQTNILLLDPVKSPTRPARPNFLLNAVIGLFGGMMLGIGLVFVMEALDRRIRSAQDLCIDFAVPVLARLGPRRSPVLPGRLARLVSPQ